MLGRSCIDFWDRRFKESFNLPSHTQIGRKLGQVSQGESGVGGVRVGDSPALRVFLTGATCRDLVDLSPAPMPPLVAGAEVTIATIFPVSVSNVTFRCRDRFGNTGTAQSSVNVVLSKSNHATRTSR